MKKFTKILSLFFVAAVAFTLAACGAKTEAPKTNAPVQTTTKAPVVTTKAPVVTTKAPEVTTKAPEVTTAAPHTVHDYSGEYKHDEDGHWKECTVCGNKSEVEEHEFEKGAVTPSTPTEKGSVTYTCSVCGYTYTDELPLAFVWEVADGAYLTDFTSLQNDPHFTIEYSEDGNTVHLITATDAGWSAIVAYSSGSTAGYGMKMTVSCDEGLAEGQKAAFICKPNNVAYGWCYDLNANPGETKTICKAGADIPAEMEKIVIMANDNNGVGRNGHISFQWVKLTYAETPTYTYDDATNMLIPTYACTTEGFTSYTKTGEAVEPTFSETPTWAFDATTNKLVPTYACTNEGFEEHSKTGEAVDVAQTTIKDALKTTETSKVPQIMSGYVTEISDSDARGVTALVFKDADGEYLIMTSEMSKLGTLFTYAMKDGAIEATYKHIDNFKDLGLVEGDFVTLIGIISKYNDGTLHFYSEMISKGDEAANLANQAFTTVPTVPEGATADKESYKFGETVTVSFTKTAEQSVSDCYVQRASGAKEVLTPSADNKVTFKSGVHDTFVVTFVDYRYLTQYEITGADAPSAYGDLAAMTNPTIPLAGMQVSASAGYVQFKQTNGALGNTSSVGALNKITLTRNPSTGTSKTRSIKVYASNAPITNPSADGVTLIETVNYAANDVEVKTVDVVSKGVFQYFMIGQVTNGALNLKITVDTSVPTGAYDIMAITTNPTASEFNVRNYKSTNAYGAWITQANKNGWVLGGNFPNPLKLDAYAEKKAVAMVITASAKGYTSENCYTQLKFTDVSNQSLKPEDFTWSLTEAFQTKVFMLDDATLYNEGTLATFLAKDTWKFCTCNYCSDGANVTFYTWQAYIIMADAE